VNPYPVCAQIMTLLKQPSRRTISILKQIKQEDFANPWSVVFTP